MLKRFLSYYKPHIRLFTLDMLASLIVAITSIVYPIITRSMINTLIPEQNYRMIVISGCILLAIYAVRMCLNFFIQYQGHIMGVKMQARMRNDLFNKFESLPYSYFNAHETGKLMSRITGDLMSMSELAHHGPENVIICTISIIISFIYLLNINTWLTIIVFMAVPFLVLISVAIRKNMKNAFLESRKAEAEINGAIQSSIAGIRVTKAFTNAKKEEEKFQVGNKQFIEARKKAFKAMGQHHSGTTFVTEVFNVIILIAGGLFLNSGAISFGDYSAFVVSINLFLSPVNTLINFMEQFQEGVTGFERFVEIMDTESEKDDENAEELTDVEGHIEFRNVTYAYEDDETREVLHNVSFEIKKGEKFALVGPSGGGKTTICHLIPRFFRVNQGEILIDGKNVNSVTMDSLRKNIGIVQQDIYLFNSTIRDNILYGKLDATDEEVILAAKRANIHDYIMSLEHGYDTQIGERGVRLSGGQKQRLSIARVFLKNPPVLILDEATSALDNNTEILIQSALDELCKGRTTIVVAHRLSTIKNAEKIGVIEDGTLAELGTHEELMANDGLYKKLYSQQFREYEKF